MKRTLLIVFAMLALSLQSFCQVTGSSFEAYVLKYRFGAEPLDYFKQNNIEVTNMLAINSIAQDGNVNKVDATKVRATLANLYRNSDSGGRLLIDWEKAVFKDLRDYPVTDSRYITAEAEWLKLIGIIREMRPNVEIGIYGIPFRSWASSTIIKFNPPGKYDNLLSRADFIAPSVYLQHPDEEMGRERNLQYIKDNMNVALDYGKRLKKPVYPLFWHRIHPQSCDAYSYELIQPDIFAFYIKFLSTYSYNNYKASGFYWWEAFGKSDKLIQLDGINDWAKGLVTDLSSYDALMVKYATAVVKALGEQDTAPEPEPIPTPAPVPSDVAGFTLLDAGTGQPMQALENGDSLNLAMLPTKGFNIRANASTVVGSVVLSLSGAQGFNATESKAPYDLMGDFGNWTPVAGSYRLKATPYSGAKATGTAGTPYEISFKVVNTPLASTSPTPSDVAGFTLLDAGTGQPMQALKNGDSLNLAMLPTKGFNIRTNASTVVGSVVLSLSGAQGFNATESKAPYDLMGDFGNWTPVAGNYRLKATPYSGAKATGTAGTPYEISFKVVNTPLVATEPQGPTFTLVDAGTDKDILTLTNGAIINLAAMPTKNLNIRYNSLTKVGSVAFSLSGVKLRSTVESGAPYALFGDQSGNYNAWVPALGSYTLKATPYSERAAAGTAGESLSINFSVENNAVGNLGVSLSSNMTSENSFKVEAGLAPTEFKVYPVPATTVLYVDFVSGVVERAVTIELLDISGRKLLTKKLEAATNERTAKLNVDNLSEGVYILTVSTSEGRSTRRVVIK